MIPKFLEGGAYGVLNDVLSILHADDGYAQPNRYEVIINPPSLCLLYIVKFGVSLLLNSRD